MINESELIEKEIVLRNLRLPNEVLETRRAMVRWLALSLGIINPGESRLGAIAVLDALLYFQFVKRSEARVADLSSYIVQNWEEMNEKTLRYHLLRMKKMGVVENEHGTFYLVPPKTGDRYDALGWSKSLFESDYKEIMEKVGNVINELKNKQAGVQA